MSWKAQWCRWPEKQATLGGDSCTRPGILVVDDNRMVRGLLHSVLFQHGFAVWSTPDGAGAVKAYCRNQSRIHLALLDVCLADLDGPQTALALRAVNPKVRYCFMTGGDGPYTADDLWAFGAAQAFEKPFRLVDFVRTLRKLVEPSSRPGGSGWAPSQN